MSRKIIILLFVTACLFVLITSSFKNNSGYYFSQYKNNIHSLKTELEKVYASVAAANWQHNTDKEKLTVAINKARIKLKACDFWLRYLEPVAYKKMNGPLPVEWETEVFEKFEAPYKREGAGLTLAYQYAEEEQIQKDSLLRLLDAPIQSINTFFEDSITSQLNNYHHFFLCNRLYLLQLATIYTTGFECPDTKQVIPELHSLLQNTLAIYQAYNSDFAGHALNDTYLALYNRAIQFVKGQPTDYELFNHYTFIRDYVNPLFKLNQQHIAQYKVGSSSVIDYSLNDTVSSIFDKALYKAQNTKGVYSRIKDEKILLEIDSIGKLLFYDPVLSGNNLRSCASCHSLDNYLTDTSNALRYNRNGLLSRNSPSLINSIYNHLLLADGKILTLTDQVKDVIANMEEMGSNEEEVLKKVLSIPAYKKKLSKFALHTSEKEVSIKHIASAITYFYGKFSQYQAPFDEAMNLKKELNAEAIKGFNIFMSKAQCGTCHFAPQFNGIKPPYTNNEFEVIGVPMNNAAKEISSDEGRYKVHAAVETKNAFRTPTIRNAAFTKPYMHNGLHTSLEEVIDFYDAGGGAGKGIPVYNQTLPADSLRLSKEEKGQLIAFIHSLNEVIPFEKAPQNLPLSNKKELNRRKAGGEY